MLDTNISEDCNHFPICLLLINHPLDPTTMSILIIIMFIITTIVIIIIIILIIIIVIIVICLSLINPYNFHRHSLYLVFIIFIFNDTFYHHHSSFTSKYLKNIPLMSNAVFELRLMVACPRIIRYNESLPEKKQVYGKGSFWIHASCISLLTDQHGPCRKEKQISVNIRLGLFSEKTRSKAK